MPCFCPSFCSAEASHFVHFVWNHFALSLPLVGHQEKEKCFSFTVMKSLENKMPLAGVNLKRRALSTSRLLHTVAELFPLQTHFVCVCESLSSGLNKLSSCLQTL